MDATFNTFFNILNQVILIGLTLMAPDGKLGWYNVPFALLLISLNCSAILVWRRSNAQTALQYYSKANVRCFLILAILGIVLVGGLSVADSFRLKT